MGCLSTYTTLLSFLVSAQLYNIVKDILEKAELETYIERSTPHRNLTYKLHYHITPPVGFMNKPNGFLFFKNEYHLFYQFYPYDTQWGPLHWGHVASPNLVDWRLLPTALRPEREQCFSGSAVDIEGIMVLFYTAVQANDEPPYYNESQNVAYSSDGVDFHKYDHNPVDLHRPKGTHELRDPKIWKHKNYWYAVLGSKSEDHKGSALLYKSNSIMSEWEFQSVLATADCDLGNMWENPDFFEINGKFILLITPKGVSTRGKQNHTYQTGYFIGSFDYHTCKFTQETDFQIIDFGHDFYATQTTEKNGERFLIAWFGMWESAHPEDVEGWVGAMTLVRKLVLVGNRLLMKPIKDITKLRLQTVKDGVWQHNSTLEFNKTAEIIIRRIIVKKGIELEIVGSRGGDKISVHWNPSIGTIILDRAGDLRQVAWRPMGATWRIFLDASSFELFCGIGEVVFSSRIYPSGDWRVINKSSHNLSVVAYTLKKSTT